MSQLTIVPHGDAAAVILPASILRSFGLGIGDVLEATVGDQELVLRPIADAKRAESMKQITEEVFERRRDAYQRLA
jgi:antitoxin component of MazEF toxin-antitoxin module